MLKDFQNWNERPLDTVVEGFVHLQQYHIKEVARALAGTGQYVLMCGFPTAGVMSNFAVQPQNTASSTKCNQQTPNELEGVQPSNIRNYDETNLIHDLGNKRIITKRGMKYPERIINCMQTATSLMFCSSASGKILPPYVVYKAEAIRSTWTENGPPGTRYNRSKSGKTQLNRVKLEPSYNKKPKQQLQTK